MIVDNLINKRVPFQFHGIKSQFDLSFGLFSSFDIDVGTKLLLKTIAKEIDFASIHKIVDIGCGVGSLSLPLLLKHPETNLVAVDRDSLALEFTKHNAKLNKIDNKRVQLRSGLLFDDLKETDKFDLIISNIPAKIGEPALNDFFKSSIIHLEKDSIVAVVIVNSLKDIAEKILKKLKYKVIYKEIGKGHSVFHFTKDSNNIKNDKNKSLSSHYIRIEDDFDIGSCKLPMKRVYNLPNFDLPSYRLQLSFEILQCCDMGKIQLYIDPIQGHLPLFLNFDRWPREIHLASRDLLQLKITKENLLLNNFDGLIEIHHLPDLLSLKEKFEDGYFDQLFFDTNPITKTPWYIEQREIADYLVRTNGNYFTCGKSNDLYNIVKHNKGFKAIQDKKYRGERALLYKKN